MKTNRHRPIDIYALDDLVEQWIPSTPYTPEEALMVSAFIQAHKKKQAALEKRRAKRAAQKAQLKQEK
jgi:hypothetical protein